MSDQLTQMLKRHEGLRLKTYLDTVGVATIGYGHALPDAGTSLQAIGRQLHPGDTITNAEAEELLAYDIAVARTMLVINMRGFEALDPVRQAVMVDMCFNLGWSRLSGFKNTLSLIASQRYRDAAKAMQDSLWADQVGDRADELAQMMRKGAWQQ